MVSFPNNVANSSDFCLSPAMMRSPVTLWVIVPFTLGVPSTLNTGIGWGMGSKGSFDFRAQDSSMKSPPVPELIKALVSTVQSLQVIDTGIRMNCLDTSATTTGETVTSGRCDVDAADRFKNPPARRA